ncbi:beta-hexosaminidase subunit alpha-like [Brachionus plicatilis]|uniref:Beta-hexosaminidase n=1 Tax=Brachionus plicatilis TaxID=10195 RepID=A0A3M7R7F3_BRAPC|nr:beta-hexosaminidase subunit alpha-like [Brachionus plicatilis]
MEIVYFLALAFIFLVKTNQAIRLKNVVPITKGQVFPKPQMQISFGTQNILNKNEFRFEYVKGSQICDVVSIAFKRYYKIIFDSRLLRQTNRIKNVSSIKKLTLMVHEPCELYPNLESDESYNLKIASSIAYLESKTLWGALRGLESFSQMIIESDDGSLVINDTLINDFPRFNHRGILLDTSRHYIRSSIIKVHLDAMEANKMNVFHWHIVDDESFPFVSSSFPDLSKKGAYNPYTHVYTSDDVKEIIEYARLRGIRVVSEFDTPGHTQSWGKSIQILTKCYTGEKPNGDFGPIDPTNNLTYSFLEEFLTELTAVFPDKYLHLGGDEVDFSCWQSNPDIAEFMKQKGFGKDYSKLEQFYMQKLLDLINKVSPKSGYIIWQEVVDNNVVVKPDTVVEVWKDPWPEELSMVTKLGYRALLSTCWYLNYISYGDDWKKYYKCDPYDFPGTDKQKSLVIGGEACMWGEYVDGSNVISRTWPRTSAVAERLWSAQNVTNVADAQGRIEEHRCRMIKRGIKAEPFNGSGHCEYEVDL